MKRITFDPDELDEQEIGTLSAMIDLAMANGKAVLTGAQVSAGRGPKLSEENLDVIRNDILEIMRKHFPALNFRIVSGPVDPPPEQREACKAPNPRRR